MRLRPWSLVALLLVAVACGDQGDARPAPAAASRAVVSELFSGADDAFYELPDPLPEGEHGDLLRYQPLPDVDVPGTAYRVMYLSESVAGSPIAVTGVVAVPAGVGQDRPVVTWAHGTTGIADACAPSKAPAEAVPFAAQVLERGWLMAATDYEGLGTPGRHPYIVGTSEGRGTLDIVRAAAQLPGSGAGPRTVIWGHSQGGHAALFAAEEAEAWTPELEVLATVAGAPPAQLRALVQLLQAGEYPGYLALAAAGINAAHPEARLEEVLTPAGRELLGVVDEACLGGVFEAFAGVSTEEFVRADPAEAEPWRSLLTENDPGQVATDAPLLLIHGEADTLIPPASSQVLFEHLCRLGQVAERRTYPDRGHADVVLAALPDVLAWTDARVAGEPTAGTCPRG